LYHQNSSFITVTITNFKATVEQPPAPPPPSTTATVALAATSLHCRRIRCQAAGHQPSITVLSACPPCAPRRPVRFALAAGQPGPTPAHRCQVLAMEEWASQMTHVGVADDTGRRTTKFSTHTSHFIRIHEDALGCCLMPHTSHPKTSHVDLTPIILECEVSKRMDYRPILVLLKVIQIISENYGKAWGTPTTPPLLSKVGVAGAAKKSAYILCHSGEGCL